METQSLTLQIALFRLFHSIAHLRKAQICHLDVKNAYLHALVDEEVYMEQPTGFVDPERPDHVCKMNWALYGMKQAGRLWNQLAHQILVTKSLKQNNYDPCVYYDDLNGDRWIIVLIFVDDLLVIGSSTRSDEFISNITKKLCISLNSELKQYISVDVDTHPNGGFSYLRLWIY